MTSRQAVRLAGVLLLSAPVLLALAACQPAPPVLAEPAAPQAADAAVLPAPLAAEPEEPADTPAEEPAAALQPAGAPGLAPGTVILDTAQQISAPGADVELAFESPAYQAVRLDVRLLEGAVGYHVRLLDKFGNTLNLILADSARPTESVSELTLPFEGRYRLLVTPLEGAATLQITITALDAPSGGQVLGGPGDRASAVMGAERVFHTYRFPLEQGEVVTLAARGTEDSSPDLMLLVFGPDGRLTGWANDTQPSDNLNAEMRGFVAPLTGTYVAVVGSVGDMTGEYAFSVEPQTVPPPAAGEPDLQMDNEYRAAFFDGSVLRPTFDGELGDVLRIAVVNPDPMVDVDVRLISPFGQVIAYALDGGPGQGEVLSEVQLPYSGRYTLELTPHGSGQASFRVRRLSADDLTGGGVFGDDLSGTRPGRVEARNVFHAYQFNARAGNRVTLIVRSQSTAGLLDLGFALLGPDGRQAVFASGPLDGSGRDPQLVGYEVSQTGTYTVIVYAFGSGRGTYELDYQRQE